MAKYDAQCSACDNKFEFSARIEFYNDPPECPLCSGPTRRIILAAPQGFVKGKFEPFKSSVDGSLITTARDLEEHNKRNRVVNIHDGYSEEAVIKGSFSAPKEEKHAEDIAEDIQAAIHDVTNGYTPIIGVQEDD
jgi:putative FmdB family regulatory protein